MKKTSMMVLKVMAVAAILVAAVTLGNWSTVSGASYNWLQYNGDPQHSGVNTNETIISTTNVASLKQKFQITLPDTADGAPVYLSGVTTSTGVRNLLFLETKAGWILAVDAQTGSVVWSHQNGPGTCKINNSGGACYTTSSPAIDPNLKYVYVYGLDGKVHKYQVADGTEIVDTNWPEVITLKNFDEKGGTALAFATAKSGVTYLYMGSGGYLGDQGDYQGHVTAINLGTGAQKVFNAMCSNQAVHFVEKPGTPDCAGVQSAVWSRPGVVYDPDTDKIYFATGNANYTPSSHYWGDSILALTPDGSGASGNPVDSYTPTNYATLQSADADLGSTAPAILPPLAGSSVAHLAVQGGKDAKLRFVNLDNLSGQGGPGHTGGEVGAIYNVPQGNKVFSQPLAWTNPANGQVWLFVANGSGISGMRVGVSSGIPTLTTAWQSGVAGFSPVLANGILYYASSGSVRALNPTTGGLLWSGSIGSIHWESPVVVNGMLYITDESAHLTAYSPGTVSATATATKTPLPPTATSTPGAPTATATATSGVPTATATRTPVPPTPTNTPVPLTVPAAPSNLTGSAILSGTTDTVTLTWKDNSNNESGFTVQGATNSTFTTGLNSATVGPNITTTSGTGIPRGVTLYFRVKAFNSAGSSVWSNVFSLTTP